MKINSYDAYFKSVTDYYDPEGNTWVYKICRAEGVLLSPSIYIYQRQYNQLYKSRNRTTLHQEDKMVLTANIKIVCNCMQI